MNTQTVVFEQDNKQIIQEGSKFFTRVFQNGENFESADFNTLERAKLSLDIAPTITENNQLVAEFMQFNIDKRNPNTILYHSDWNWLMEVVEKIYSLELEEEVVLIVRDGLAEANITSTYDAVVKFIEWYNKQNQ